MSRIYEEKNNMRNVDEKLAEWIVNIKSLWKYYLLVALVVRMCVCVCVQRKENNGSRIFNGNTYVSDALAKCTNKTQAKLRREEKNEKNSQNKKNKEFLFESFLFALIKWK